MAKHRIHSIEFKRQVALDFVAGETLHGLAKRHDISRNLIRIGWKKLEAGAFDDARAADLLQEYEAKIAALERMVGRQALEIEFLKGGAEKRKAEAALLIGESLPNVEAPSRPRQAFLPAGDTCPNSHSSCPALAQPRLCRPKRMAADLRAYRRCKGVYKQPDFLGFRRCASTPSSVSDNW